MHVKHSVVDESDPRLYGILSSTSYYYHRKHAVVRFACGLFDVSFPLELHAPARKRIHDGRFADSDNVHTSFPHIQETTVVRYRLVRRNPLGGFGVGNYLSV